MSDDVDAEAVEFGDADPEDMWDDIDPFRVRLEILERILEELSERRDERFRVRLEDALRLIGKMVREHQEDTVRLERIREALEALD
jgi:hypothetical protein